MKEDIGHITGILGEGEPGQISKNRSTLWQYRRKKWCDCSLAEPHQGTGERWQHASLPRCSPPHVNATASHGSLDTTHPKVYGSDKESFKQTHQQGRGIDFSCREICRGDFMSQEGRHGPFWIHELTWSEQAHLSPALQVDYFMKQLLLILEKWREKSMWKYESPKEYKQECYPSSSGNSNTLL